MKEFIGSLQRLALSPDAQLASLPDGCCKADDLALDFDDFWRVEGVVIPAKAKPLVEELDQMLDRMSGQANVDLWTDDAVRQRPEWEKVRAKARDILKAMKEEPQPPVAGYGSQARRT